jgi:hypothetical protein
LAKICQLEKHWIIIHKSKPTPKFSVIMICSHDSPQAKYVALPVGIFCSLGEEIMQYILHGQGDYANIFCMLSLNLMLVSDDGSITQSSCLFCTCWIIFFLQECVFSHLWGCTSQLIEFEGQVKKFSIHMLNGFHYIAALHCIMMKFLSLFTVLGGSLILLFITFISEFFFKKIQNQRTSGSFWLKNFQN